VTGSGVLLHYCWRQYQQKKTRSSKGSGRNSAGYTAALGECSSTNNNPDLIYLDYNGTTPVYPFVLDAMLPFFQQHYGNPGSTHVAGDVPRTAIDTARYQVLTHLLGCHCGDTTATAASTDSASETASATTTTPLTACIFTACGTESDNLAIHLALEAWDIRNRQGDTSNRGSLPMIPHIVTSNVEHPAIELCLQAHEQAGRCNVTRVPVQTDGRVMAKDMIAAIQSNTYVSKL
jgi:cysteine desulfurase